MGLNKKYEMLVDYIESLESLVIAFSGGVDSSFLLRAAKDALGDNCLALTIKAPFHPGWEIEEARALARKLGVKHIVLERDHIPQQIINNPGDRCYLCKRIIFQEILDFARSNNYKYVADGSNFDDTKDYRPGMRALEELKVISPLLDIGFTKDEIRQMSRRLNLPTWDKPAYACLLTRIEHGQMITEVDLRKIERAESYIFSLGFPIARVRLHGQLARIEVAANQLEDLLKKEIIEKVIMNFKKIGFQYITVDLEGYRMGSQNEVL